MASLPLQRSLKKATREGWLGDIVERYIAFPKPWGHRRDFLKLFDALFVKGPPVEVMGVQACRDADVAAHVTKIREGYWEVKGKKGKEVRRFIGPNKYLARFKAMGGRGVIWGWSQKPKDGVRGARKVWTCREIEL